MDNLKNMDNHLFKVQVLMSTYNGADYIIEQIKSIMEQTDVETYLLIRDDGSKDETVINIKKMQKLYPKNIDLITGTNIGYRKSFLYLLGKKDYSMDFYAYADQDDVWLPKKLKKGIDALLNCQDAWLYTSALTITDKNLNIIYNKEIKKVKLTLQSFFVRTRLAGCTYIFTKELAEVGSKYAMLNEKHEKMPDHDCLLCMLCMLYKKVILIDNESNIMHRRTQQSETSGLGFKKRMQVEWNRIIRRKNCYQYTASLLLEEMNFIGQAKDFYIEDFLNQVVKSNCGLKNKFRLIFNSDFSCGIFLADILIRVKVLLGYY